MTGKIVLPTDDIAAKPATLTGWISHDGRFYAGDNAESIARWAGATHVPCRHCGAPTPKHWTACEPCRDAADQLRWDALPERKPADGEPIYSDAFDEYHYSIDSAIDDAHERDVPLEQLRLLCCEPVYAHPIGTEEWSDDLPEDGDAPATLLNAIDAFNKTVAGLSLSWRPGNHRVKLPLPQEVGK